MHELAARIPWIIAGLAMLVLAGALLALRSRHRPTRVFALFLVVRAVSLPDAHFILHQAGTALLLAQFDAVAEISLTFIALLFVLLYPRPRPRVERRPWLLPLVPLTLAAPLALLLVEPQLFASYDVQPNGTVEEARLGPLSLFWDIQLVVYAALGLVFARDAVHEPRGAMRTGLVLVAVGFSVLSLYHGPSVGLGLLRVALGLDEAPQTYLLWGRALMASSVGFGIAAIVVFVRHWPAARMRERRVLSGVFAAYGTALATGAVVGGFQLWPYEIWRTMSVDDLAQGIFRSALPVLVAYALARHRVFTLDLGVKWTLRQGTIVALALAAVLVAREVAAVAGLDRLATMLGLGAVVVLVVALLRLYHVADRIADAAMPAVKPSEAYLDQRRLEAYRTALGDALDRDGVLSAHAVTQLARLRARLGISERDHQILLLTVAHNGGRDGAPMPVPGELFLGRYRVEGVLGTGGQGTTFLAHDTDIDRAVVIKAIHAAGPTERVLEEARAMGSIPHPHVATIYGVERVGGQVFIVMEHLSGGSLAARLERGVLEDRELVGVGRAVLAGLGAIHGRGIIHRDVKPSNILLAADGTAKLADFGIAQAGDADATLAPTAGSAALGTVRYMAPEQARGRAVTKASDLFSTGATLFEAYMGVPYLAPRPGETAVELQMRAAAAGPFDVARFEGSKALATWFTKALAPHPDDRFASAQAMSNALARAVDGQGAGPGLRSPRRGRTEADAMSRKQSGRRY